MMSKANFAPVYACIYPELAKLVRQHGYALAAHGSMARDFDLVCIPWADKPSEIKDVIETILGSFSLKVIGKPALKNHGRIAYTVSLGFGECFIDLSFMPVSTNSQINADRRM